MPAIHLEQIKREFEALEKSLGDIKQMGRELAIAWTKLQESKMWFEKHLDSKK